MPVSVKSTNNYDYVTMRCGGCGHTYVTTSPAAFRMAVAYKLATNHLEK